MRVMQYAERMRSGAMKTAIRPEVRATKTGATIVDGGMGSGIPAMLLAYETVAAAGFPMLPGTFVVPERTGSRPCEGILRKDLCMNWQKLADTAIFRHACARR